MDKKATQSCPTVYVGMSGGVDSSLSALLLKEQGYHVVGVYMKNWSKDLPGMKCPWAEDLADAKRVAVKLGIDFKVFDFETEYKQKVVDYMLAEFKKGNTPNPDIMCNQEIKFKLFYEVARENGADFIATGHYAKTDGKNLLKARDENKDQTYFLYRISEEALAHTIFPIGDMLKADVKKLAEQKGLHNAYKKESMGVCFVGEVGIKDFLLGYFEPKIGEIKDVDSGEVLGYHDGAIFYTIGQRHGLNIGGGLPYYVVGKDTEKNELYVSRNLNNQELWTDKLVLRNILLRGYCFQNYAQAGKPSVSAETPVATGVSDAVLETGSLNKISLRAPEESKFLVRLRHRGELIPATLINDTLHFDVQIKRPAAGQSAVFYDGDVCLGGGIIA